MAKNNNNKVEEMNNVAVEATEETAIEAVEEKVKSIDLDYYESVEMQTPDGNVVLVTKKKPLLKRGKIWVEKHPKTTFGVALGVTTLIAGAIALVKGCNSNSSEFEEGESPDYGDDEEETTVEEL